MQKTEVIGTENFEIERKYLISMPDEEYLRVLCAEKGGEIWDMEQIYLDAAPGVSSRIRKVVCGGRTEYYRTDKTHVTDVKRIENERRISASEFEILTECAAEGLSPIRKTRYRIPSGDVTLEIDVFPFWKRQAFLETELSSENQEVSLPDYISVIREVTSDGRYSNFALARSIPEEE